MENKIKIGIVSLGCAKNLADMEAILANLEEVELVNIREAEVVFLNTCGFLKSARDEVYENLKNLADKIVIVTGCMAGLLKRNVFNEYPQIYAVVSGVFYKDIEEIFQKVSRGEKVYAVADEPFVFQELSGKTLLTPESYAYVKIAEGCDNRCSYCLIPKLKGKYRSRKMEDILEEVKMLVDLGTKEIILVAQDCGYYGVDLYKKKSLALLLNKIAEIEGDFWIRVLYVYPERIDDELLEVIEKNNKICKYLDIPLQHGDPEILKKMNRVSDLELVYKKIVHIREKIPNITLRSSFIVGFPGETEDAFLNLINFIKKINFDHVGIFEFSKEKGTLAAHLEGDIEDELKKKRREESMLIQQKISFDKNKELVGQMFKVLIEQYDEGKKIYTGRSERFAPEVDGQIFIKSDQKLNLNNFYDIKIIRAEEYDLFGEIILN